MQKIWNEFIAKIISVFIMPIVVFGTAYIGGLILARFAGNVVTEGLNVIFVTNRFTPEMIAPTFATFSLIASIIKKEKNK